MIGAGKPKEVEEQKAKEQVRMEEGILKRKPVPINGADRDQEEILKPVAINGGADGDLDNKPKPKTVLIIDREERKPEVEQDQCKHIEERLAAHYNIPLEVFSAGSESSDRVLVYNISRFHEPSSTRAAPPSSTSNHFSPENMLSPSR